MHTAPALSSAEAASSHRGRPTTAATPQQAPPITSTSANTPITSSTSTSNGQKEIVPATSYLIQLSSAGPQVQSAFPLESSRRLLDVDQEKWFIQYISKDLLNLETVAGHAATTTAAFPSNASMQDDHMSDMNGGGQLSSSSNPADLQWIKVAELPQLGITAVTLYFIMYDFDDIKHCFAAVVVIPNVLTYKKTLSSICDRLKKIHTRVTSIFKGEDGIEEEDELMVNRGGGQQLNTTIASAGNVGGVVEEEGGGGVGGGAALVPTTTNAITTSGEGGTMNDESTGDVMSGFSLAGKSDDTLHPAAAIAPGGSSIAFTTLTSPLPSQSMGSSSGGGVNNAHHTIRLSPELMLADRNYYNNKNYCGVGSADEAEYHEMWGWELSAAARDVGFWVRGALNRNDISLQETVFGHTYFSIACATSYRTARDCFHFVLTLALSENQIIIRGGDAQAVNEWLATIALFIQDDKLNMVSRRCFDDSVIPDLNLQGTTLERKEIVKRLMWFRSLTCIIDLDGFVHGGWSAVHKKLQSRLHKQQQQQQHMSSTTTRASSHSNQNDGAGVPSYLATFGGSSLYYGSGVGGGGEGVSFGSMPGAVGSSTSSDPATSNRFFQATGGDFGPFVATSNGGGGGGGNVVADGGGRLLDITDGQAPMEGASFFHSKEHYFSGLCVYAPIRDGRRKRYSSFKDWRDKQIKLRAYLQPGDFMSRSVNFKSITSAYADAICARVLKVVEHNCHVLLRDSYIELREKETNMAVAAAVAAVSGSGGGDNKTDCYSTAGGGCSTNARPPGAATLTSTPTHPAKPPNTTSSWSVDDELEHATANIRFSLDQWRRTLMLRALSFYVCEEEFRASESIQEKDMQSLVDRKRGPEMLRLSDGDHHLMLSTVEPLASVGQKIHDRVQRALADNLKF